MLYNYSTECTLDDAEIQKRIDDLDAAVSKDGATLIIYVEDIEQGICEFIGNRKGYLRAGIEFLRAAMSRMHPADSFTSVNLDYLTPARSLREAS